VFRKRSRSLCEGIVHVHAEIACITIRPMLIIVFREFDLTYSTALWI